MNDLEVYLAAPEGSRPTVSRIQAAANRMLGDARRLGMPNDTFREILAARDAAIKKMVGGSPAPVTDCCGTRLAQGHDGWAYGETFCRECDKQVCSACAGVHEQEGGYGDDGTGVRTFARCKACEVTR